MTVIEMGTDPDLAKMSEYDVWTALARHRRCGTRVKLAQLDVQVAHGWDGGTFAWWVCPLCQRDKKIMLRWWEYPRWMRSLKMDLQTGKLKRVP